MDKTTIDGVLADMAYRRVDAMRRRLIEDIVDRHLQATGEAPSQDIIRKNYEALWVEPTSEHLLNMAAAKCAASKEYHASELAHASGEVDRIREKMEPENWGARADLAEALSNAQEEDLPAKITAASAAADELLQAAIAAGGDPSKAPGNENAVRVVSARVAEAVDQLMEEMVF